MNNILHQIQDIRLYKILFTEESFTSSSTLPHYKIFKQNQVWTIQLWISKHIYTYNYPFRFNSFFLNYKTKYELILKLQILKAFSQKQLIKQFDLKALLHKKSNYQLK